MEFKEIQDLLKLVNKSSLTEVEIEQKDFKLKIKRKTPESSVIYTTQQAPISPAPLPLPAPEPVAEAAPAKPAKPAAPPAAEAPAQDLYEFRSPMIGTFYRASSPDVPPFAKVGDSIQKGDVVCIIEAMKLFNEIESEISGKVVKIMVEDAQPVEYDQVLFLIDTNA